MTTVPATHPTLTREEADLHSPRSFDHVGRDRGNVGFVAWQVLADLADTDDRIVGCTADLTWVTRLADFAARHPDRALNFGISERNMISAAAGIATCGLIPYVTTFASFSAILAYENIRTDLAYPGLPVRVLATHTGISMGFFGTSHHATEDIAALRAVAGLTVLSPADPTSTEALIRATVDLPGPIYFRMGRGAEGILYEDAPTWNGPEPWIVRQGEDVLLVSTGIMVGACAIAADRLADGGVTATVLDVHTLKPFDAAAVARHAQGHRAVVVVEEHNIEGGLGTMVVEALAQHGCTTPIHKHGLRDEYAIVGPPTGLYRYYGLDAGGIKTVSQRALEALEGPTALADMRGALWRDDDRAAVLAERKASR